MGAGNGAPRGAIATRTGTLSGSRSDSIVAVIRKVSPVLATPAHTVAGRRDAKVSTGPNGCPGARRATRIRWVASRICVSVHATTASPLGAIALCTFSIRQSSERASSTGAPHAPPGSRTATTTALPS